MYVSLVHPFCFLVIVQEGKEVLIIKNRINIKVFGVGNVGCSIIKPLILDDRYNRMRFYALNTDLEELLDIPKSNRCLIGKRLSNCRITQANLSFGRSAAISSKKVIMKKMQGADLILLTACLGSDTGTGAIPVLSRYAKKTNALTIVIITTNHNEEDLQIDHKLIIQELYQYADTVMITNPKDKNMDETIRQGIVALYQLISKPSYINVDYADIKTVFGHKHNGFIAFGSGCGPTKLNDALDQVLQYVQLEKHMDEQHSMIIQVRVCLDITLQDIEYLMNVMNEKLGVEMEMILGVSFDQNLVDTIMITIFSACAIE